MAKWDLEKPHKENNTKDNKMNWWKFLIAVAAIIQLILVMLAEYQEEYIKASYELLWMFFFTYLYHMEDKK